MPIIGLTNDVAPRFPRIGKLRKGGERPKDGKRPGADLEYFRFTSELPEVVEAFQEVYGERPTAIRVYLPYKTVEENFSTWKEKWQAGGLVHRCDGQTMTIWRKPDGTYSQEEKPCDGGCKEVGRLEMVIPEMLQAGYVGYVTLETHSLNDLINITAALRATAEARRDNPLGLKGIEFTLRRRKEKISTPGENGSRVRREKWMVVLEPSATWIETQYQLSRQAEPLQLIDRRVDYETGEITDDEPEDAEFEEMPEQSGRTVDEIIEALRLDSKKLYAKCKDEPPVTNQFTLFISLLGRIADSDDRRLTFLREVFEINESSKELSRRQVMAILDWIDPQEYQEGNKTKYRVGNPNAINEFNLVVNAAIHRGMDELPGFDEDMVVAEYPEGEGRESEEPQAEEIPL